MFLDALVSIGCISTNESHFLGAPISLLFRARPGLFGGRGRVFFCRSDVYRRTDNFAAQQKKPVPDGTGSDLQMEGPPDASQPETRSGR